MRLTFSLDNADYLTYQLYLASKSPKIIKKRKRGKVTVPAFYGALGFLFLIYGNITISIIFYLLAIVWYLVYPRWEKIYYTRYYTNWITKTLKEEPVSEQVIDIDQTRILATDKDGESTIPANEIEQITEIPDLILIRVKSGHSLVLPKNKLQPIEPITSELKALTDNLKIPYKAEKDWRWK